MLDFIRGQAQSWIVKVVFGIIILVFILYFGVGTMQGDRTQIAATVDGRPILVKDFFKAYERAVEMLRQRNPGLDAEAMKNLKIKEQVLRQMVLEQLMRREAERLGLTASAAEIYYDIAQAPTFQGKDGKFDRDRYNQVLRAQGYKPADFEAQVGDSILERKLLSHVGRAAVVDEGEVKSFFEFNREERKLDYLLAATESFTAEVKPTPEEKQAWYDKNRAKFTVPAKISFDYVLFTPKSLADRKDVPEERIAAFYKDNAQTAFATPERAQVRHILIEAPENDAAKRKAARDVIDGLALRMKKGEDFAKLAEKYSQDATNATGGDLGWIERNQTVPSFEAVAFSLEPGKVSEPVETLFGWHLLKVDKREAARIKPLEEVREDIATALAEEISRAKIADLVEQAQEQILTGVDLKKAAAELKLPLQSAKNMDRQSAAIEFGLQPKSLDALFGLAKGKATETPLNVNDGYLLAAVTDAEPESVKAFEIVTAEVERGVKEEVAQTKARDKAAKLLETVKAGPLPEALQKDLKVSPAFARRGMIPEFGAAPGLSADAFAAAQGEWLPKTYAVEAGFIVAKVKEILPPAKELWDGEKGRWTEFLIDQERQSHLAAFVEALKEKAKIEVVNPKIFE